MKKKIISTILMLTLIIGCFAACSNGDPDNGSADNTVDLAEISVISREDGSGTRGAFIELFGIEEKDDAGNKKDNTTKNATIAPKTDVMLTNVAGDEGAIGYVSLGSLNDNVKALKIDGVEATTENVKNETYKIARPFNVATKGEATGLTKDFLNFIMSAEGQAVVSDSYIAIDDAAETFQSDNSTGKIVVAGSSSVAPVMEKLIEAYKKINTGAEIELQSNDSTAGIQYVTEGTCDIGMASRELKDSEKTGLNYMAIALDGIGVIVNKANPIEELTSDQVKAIFMGETTNWGEI